MNDLKCPRCQGTRYRKDGWDRKIRQVYECSDCGAKFTDLSGKPFSKMRTHEEIIFIGLYLTKVCHYPYRKTAQLIEEAYKIKRSDVSLLKWNKKFSKAFDELRKKYKVHFTKTQKSAKAIPCEIRNKQGYLSLTKK